MSDRPPSAEERTEAARVRRRWLTLGEVLAVAAVGISGLTLWNNWSEREKTEAKEAATSAKATAQAASIALGGAADDGGRRLSLTSLRADQSIQGQTIRFPRALGVGAVETTGDARIEADWIRKGLVGARKAAKSDGAVKGDARLPVLITTRFWTDGQVRTAMGFYDVGYTLSEGGLLDGPDLKLTGLSYVGAAPSSGAAERLEALWKTRLP